MRDVDVDGEGGKETEEEKPGTKATEFDELTF